jgi:hypothetical protein
MLRARLPSSVAAIPESLGSRKIGETNVLLKQPQPFEFRQVAAAIGVPTTISSGRIHETALKGTASVMQGDAFLGSVLPASRAAA